jgi:thimet oligopeptidase
VAYHRAVLYDYTSVTAASVTAATDDAIRRADELVAAAASADPPTFESTLERMEHALAVVAEGYGRGAFMGQVHPEADVRDAGEAGEERINKWRVGLAFREDLYRAVAAVARDEGDGLEGERGRLLEHWMRDFRRAGQELEPEARAELERLRNRLVELEVAFQRNVNEARDWIELTRDELAGLPDDYIERLKPGEADGTYRVTLDYPELYPFMAQARDRARREELTRKNWNQAATVNRPLLAEAITLRQRIADLLGQPTWAHHAMELKMAARPERVREFYAELIPPLEGAAQRDLEQMAALAQRDGVDQIQIWDWAYYDNEQSRDEYGVDQNAVSEYLSLDDAMRGMFELTGEVFGLSYEELPDARAWHPSVRLYAINDRATGQLLAHFYTDLFPREGKYGHAAAFPLVVGHRGEDGQYVRPVNAIVANFTAPSADRPSLLRHGPHGELETLFHEFGHILHMSLTTAAYTRFSGADTEWDFVEAPSQIMEHWVWEPSVLGRFARHYRTGEPLPAELAAKMREARYINVGIRYARQVFFGTMDVALHTAGASPDLDAEIRRAFAVTHMPYPDETFMLGAFGHLMGGYDAGYYGYLWAEVIGDDMFGRFMREGVTSPVVGAAYRRTILEPNGSRSADEMVREFLGREPSNEAFLTLRGMTPT